jgi:hypothetical protein
MVPYTLATWMLGLVGQVANNMVEVYLSQSPKIMGPEQMTPNYECASGSQQSFAAREELLERLLSGSLVSSAHLAISISNIDDACNVSEKCISAGDWARCMWRALRLIRILCQATL